MKTSKTQRQEWRKQSGTTHRNKALLLDDVEELEAALERIMKTTTKWTVSLGGYKINSRLGSYAHARKLASRYNRLFKTDRAYAVRFGTVRQ